jgi:hypothetical protein
MVAIPTASSKTAARRPRAIVERRIAPHRSKPGAAAPAPGYDRAVRGDDRAIRPRAVAAVAAACAAAALALLAAAPSDSRSRLGPYRGLGDCPVFPAPRVAPDSPSVAGETAWNQDISKAPLDPRSSRYIAYIDHHGGTHLHADFGSLRSYGFAYAVVGRRAKRIPVHFTAYGSESTHGAYRVPPRAPVGGGPHSDGDRHVLVVDRARCRLYELYRAFFRKRPRRHWNADSGVIWNLRSARLRRRGYTSADAAGLPIFPGLVRLDEVRRGSIRHAIRVTFASTQHAWVHPGNHCAGDTHNPNAPPMGLRLRLRPGYDISRIRGGAHVIAVALKRYGLIVADNGDNWFFSGTSDHRWNDANLNQLKSIPGAAFQVVRSAATIHRC